MADGELDEEFDEEPEPTDPDRVLVLGGFQGSSVHASTELLNVTTMMLEPGPSLPEQRWGCAAIMLDRDRMLLVGGFNGFSYLNTTLIFYIASGSYVAGPCMHESRSGCSLVQLTSSHLLVIGGYSKDSTEVLNLNTMRFIQGPRLREPRGCCGAVLLDDCRLLVAGGFNLLGSTDTCEVLTFQRKKVDQIQGDNALENETTGEATQESGELDCKEEEGDLEMRNANEEGEGGEEVEDEEEDVEEDEEEDLDDLWKLSFSLGPRMEHRRAGCTACKIDQQRIIVIGGVDSGTWYSSTEVLDVETMLFAPGPVLTVKRSGCAAAQLDANRLLVVGGFDGTTNLYHSTMETLNLETMEFAPSLSMSTARAYCGIASWRQRLEPVETAKSDDD